MPWARLDDGLNDDAKLNALSAEAFRLWVRGLVYCQKNLTDGFIPTHELPRLSASVKERERPKLVAELCASLVIGKAPLWHQVESGYQMHDYLDHNDSRDKVLDERGKAKKRLDRYHNRRRFRDVARTAHNAVHNALETALGMGCEQRTDDVLNASSTYHVPQEHEKQERADAPPHVNGERVNRLNEAIVQQRRRARSQETADGKPAAKVITALARDVLRRHPDEADDLELRNLLKDACAKANLRYDATAVGEALDKARAQVRRTAG